MISLRCNFQTNALSSWDRTYRPKRSEYIKKDVVNSPNIQKDKKKSNEMVREKTRWEPFKNIA